MKPVRPAPMAVAVVAAVTNVESLTVESFTQNHSLLWLMLLAGVNFKAFVAWRLNGQMAASKGGGKDAN